MIRWRIRELMGKQYVKTGKKVTYEVITKATGISPNTLSGLATGKQKQVGVDTIDRLLTYFDCTPNDLIKKAENGHQ